MAKFNFNLINTSNPTEVDVYTEIMQRVIDGDGVSVLKEETTFTKEGFYLIAIHWVEDGASNEDKNVIREIIKDNNL